MSEDLKVFLYVSGAVLGLFAFCYAWARLAIWSGENRETNRLAKAIFGKGTVLIPEIQPKRCACKCDRYMPGTGPQ